MSVEDPAPDPTAPPGCAGGGESASPARAGAGAPVERSQISARAGQFARDSRAPATWRAYDAKWRRFEAWCAQWGEPALGASPRTVAEFLTDLAAQWRPATPEDPPGEVTEGQVLVRDGLRPATVTGYRAAIAVAHQSAGVTDPCAHEAVRQVLAGIRRQRGLNPTRRRTALRPPEMAAIQASLVPDERLVDARDAALLLIGWKAALRTDDLHRLDVGDLRVEAADTPGAADPAAPGAGLAVRLRRSKTDQAGQAVTIGITASPPRADGSPDPLDAVAAWTRWHNLLRAHGITTGPAWRGVDRYGRRPRAGRLAHQAIGLVVTHRAAAAGLVGDYGGHSLRRGFATSALAAGATERAVQNHGRWSSPASMAPYVDEAARYAETNPTRLLGS